MNDEDAIKTAAPSEAAPRSKRPQRRSALFAVGEPMIWLTGGALVLALAMILGLLTLVVSRGGSTFWPKRLDQVTLTDGTVLLGEQGDVDTYRPEAVAFERLPEDQRAAARQGVEAAGGQSTRRYFQTGNRSPSQRLDGYWVSDFEIAEESRPEWALTVERLEYGRLYGTPKAFSVGEEIVASGPEATLERYETEHGEALDRSEAAKDLEEDELGALDEALEEAEGEIRLALRRHGEDSAAHRDAEAARDRLLASQQAERERLRTRIDGLRAENRRYRMVLTAADGSDQDVLVGDIVRAYPANRLGWLERIGVYVARWWEFLTAGPREANTEGGVYPAIFGTIVMTLIMTILVVPFGVLGALYLREYARQGALVSLVRIAVNNLAGVPSIVFGVFGLGFFCYAIGGSIDQLFFEEDLPNPTYGKGGLLWASLTLALLTLPVVIVATEEALAAVPNSLREGSYACGASKWQTIRRIVLPRAMPGVMTGMILAIARGAGEVAPLMLVGAVKQAAKLPIDGTAPFVHPERSFMHLGFHIYDVGFQSPNAKAAEPLVFTTTLLLIGIVVLLNIVAIWVRARLRRQYVGG